MMDAIAYLGREIGVISGAPFVFFSALFVVGSAVFFTIQWAFATRLENAKSTIEMLQKRVDTEQAQENLVLADLRPSAAAKRVYVDQAPTQPPRLASDVAQGITPESIRRSLLGLTEYQISKIVEDLLGRRISVNGQVTGVNSRRLSGTVAVGLLVQNAGLYICRFNENEPRLSLLSIGESVQVSGVIDEIDSLGVSLSECQFISDQLD